MVPTNVMFTLVVQASTAVGWSKLQIDPHSTVLLVAQVIVGAVVSTIVSTWLQVLLLVQASVASQVRVIVNEQSEPLVTVPMTAIVTLVPLQASRAEGSSKLQFERHSAVLLVTQVITGAVVSTTVTVWLQVALLVQGSVACHVRVICSAQAVPLVMVLR